MQHYLFIVLVGLLYNSEIHAQLYHEKNFVLYTAKDGLTDNNITSLLQDDLGYIWISTDAGLNRFDGHSFSRFTGDDGKIPLLTGQIQKLRKFSSNKLGIIGRRGFQLLDAKTFSLHNYTIPDTTMFSTYLNSTWDAHILPDQSVIASGAAGFYVFLKTGELILRHDAYSGRDVGKKTIRYGRDIIPVNQEEYLIYLEGQRLASYNHRQNLFREISPQEKKWSTFISPPEFPDDHWITRYKIEENKYLFIHYEKNVIVYYDHLLNKTVTSPLPFSCSKELSYESHITKLDDKIILLNAANAGFYMLALDKSNGKVFCNPEKLLASYKIKCLLLDKDKRLWAGTPDGLLQQKMEEAFLQTYSYKNTTLPDSHFSFFTAVYPYKNKLYATRYSNNTGLVILDSKGMTIEKTISFFDAHPKWNEVESIQMYHPDTIWLGTNAGIIWLDVKTNKYGIIAGLPPAEAGKVPGIMLTPAGKDNYAWFCYKLNGIAGRYHIPTRSFTFFSSDAPQPLPFSKIKYTIYDSYGDVWISGHSLCRWNSQKEVFDTLISTYSGLRKFNDNIITISADEEGHLWFHLSENGLLKFNIKERKYTLLTRQQGLFSNDIEALSPVTDKILWIAGRGYLSCLDTRTGRVTSYTYNDGLPLNRPSARVIHYDKAGKQMYLICKNDIVRFPLQPDSSTSIAGPLLVQELTYNNQYTLHHPGNEVRLRHQENNIVIRFNVIDFENADQYNFSYRLNDAEIWTQLGQQRSIQLTDLPPGNYLLKIKARDKTGSEKMLSFNFRITPPFWKRNWFLVTLGLLLACGLLFFYQWRIRQIRQKANLDKQLMQTELKSLHAQMNPHFIFNSLNSIREMILNNETKEASHYLAKFAQLIRMTLEQSGQSFVSLRNTMDYLARYIEMEQIRNTDFSFHIRADEALDPDETVLPPMLIQPFVENAIWHGGGGVQKNITIQVEFKKKNDQLICIIEDNGIGIRQSLTTKEKTGNSHHSVAIENISSRIRLLNEKYNLKSHVDIRDKKEVETSSETGTIVTIQLPLEIADYEKN